MLRYRRRPIKRNNSAGAVGDLTQNKIELHYASLRGRRNETGSWKPDGKSEMEILELAEMNLLKIGFSFQSEFAEWRFIFSG